MHFIIDDMPDLTKVNRIDDLVVAIFFVAVEVLCLTAMAYALTPLAVSCHHVGSCRWCQQKMD